MEHDFWCVFKFWNKKKNLKSIFKFSIFWHDSLLSVRDDISLGILHLIWPATVSVHYLAVWLGERRKVKNRHFILFEKNDFTVRTAALISVCNSLGKI